MTSGNRCTVVETPGRGVLDFFWQILLGGLLGVERKYGEGGALFSRFIAFVLTSFLK
jgi:hypothetical protein